LGYISRNHEWHKANERPHAKKAAEDSRISKTQACSKGFPAAARFWSAAVFSVFCRFSIPWQALICLETQRKSDSPNVGSCQWNASLPLWLRFIKCLNDTSTGLTGFIYVSLCLYIRGALADNTNRKLLLISILLLSQYLGMHKAITVLKTFSKKRKETK
jgi:hypothetical protein